MKKQILFLVLTSFFFLALFGCPSTPSTTTTNTTNVSTNVTNNATTIGTGEGKAANWGDYVDVDYTLRDESGTVLDTSLASVAIENDLYSKERIYQPLSVPMKENNGYISGFTKALIGMKAGESKRVEIPPEEAYGVSRPELINVIPRSYTITRFEREPLDYLESRNFTNLTVNKTIMHTFWFVRIMNISEDGIVTLRHEPTPGQTIVIQGMEQTVTNITEETLTFRLDPEVGRVYSFSDQQTGQIAQATVTEATVDTVTLDYNSPLAGKKLVFELKVVKVS